MLELLIDVLVSSLKYNISLLEYFQFRFYEMDSIKRKSWAGSGFMYEYQRFMNPPKERVILDDKTLFFKKYQQFVKHLSADVSDLREDSHRAESILNNSSGKIVFKVAKGKCGANVLICGSDDFNKNSVLNFIEEEEYDLIEEYIIQHPDLIKLSPTAVNTVRIFTQLDTNDEVDILGCRLRISVNSSVDNMAAGNLAAPVDEHTGIVTGPGVYSDITKSDEVCHPLTGVNISGFKIPFWQETIVMVKAAARFHPQNRSIGWDVAITESGPDLIEGNHDWCKLLWQLPVKKGLKPTLEKYVYEYNQRG